MQKPWKSKVHEILNICQEELKKTTEIGKKMLSASKTNSELHENYEKLGLLALTDLKNGSLKWDNPEVTNLVDQISAKEEELEVIEKEVRKIKISSAPEDIDSKSTNSTSPDK